MHSPWWCLCHVCTITHRKTVVTIGVYCYLSFFMWRVHEKPTTTPFKAKWNRTELLFKHLTIKNETERMSGLYLADSIKSQCIYTAKLWVSRSMCKSYCAPKRERAPKHAPEEPSFSSFYRKGLNSCRQTDPLLYFLQGIINIPACWI